MTTPADEAEYERLVDVARRATEPDRAGEQAATAKARDALSRAPEIPQ